jgi:hypothetical protein
MHPNRLLAIKVERRSIAVAVFFGERLDHTQVRQLASDEHAAEATTADFVNWLLYTFDIGSAAVEAVGQQDDTRRGALIQTIRSILRASSIPIWEISKAELLYGFGCPALRTRKQLRNVIRNMWPILDEPNQNQAVLDAVATGVYVSTERLFVANEQSA